MAPTTLSDEKLLAATLNHSPDKIIGLHSPVLPVSAEKVEALTADPIAHSLIASPSTVHRHMEELAHQPAVVDQRPDPAGDDTPEDKAREWKQLGH